MRAETEVATIARGYAHPPDHQGERLPARDRPARRQAARRHGDRVRPERFAQRGSRQGGSRGRCLVLRAITQFGAIFQSPGVINFTASGYTLIEQSPRSAAIAGLLTACDLDGRVSDDIKTEVWRKLIFNCVINPITSITGSDVGGIADPRLDHAEAARRRRMPAGGARGRRQSSTSTSCVRSPRCSGPRATSPRCARI